MVEQQREASIAAADRRQSLVRAAFDCIAARGFEGLRTRSVAERAGVNIATLHYYFPTKEALIAGVAEYLASQFIALHAMPVRSTGSAGLDCLHQEFADARFYHAKHPDLSAVMLELQLRGRRDPTIRRVIDPLIGHWRAGIERWMEVGIAEGVFRRDLDVSAGSALLVAALWGATGLELNAGKLEQIFEEVSRWLLAPAAPAKSQRNRRTKP